MMKKDDFLNTWVYDSGIDDARPDLDKVVAAAVLAERRRVWDEIAKLRQQVEDAIFTANIKAQEIYGIRYAEYLHILNKIFPDGEPKTREQ